MYSLTINCKSLDELHDIVSKLDCVDDFIPATITRTTERAISTTPENRTDPAVNTDGAEDRDENGMPWDGRIHAATRTKTADGLWKMRRGYDKELAEQIRAEVAGEQRNPGVMPQPPKADPKEAAPCVPGKPAEPTPPAPLPLPAAPEVPQVEAVPLVPCTYDELFTTLTNRMAEPNWPIDAWERFCQELGITDPSVLTSDDNLRAQMYQKVRSV